MKNLRIILMLVMTAGLLSAATSASAVGIFAKWQDTKDMDSGFGLGLNHRFQIIPIVSVEARASWVYFDSSGPYAKLNMFPLEAAARAKLGLFYAGAGIGYYVFSGDDFPPKNAVGGFVMGGAEFTLFGLGAFAELQYQFLEPDEKDEVGGKRDMSGIGAAVGVILPFFGG